MTREEAIEYAESKKMRLEALVYNGDCKYGNYAMYSGELSFVNAALSALRPVSRERVEKVCGEWQVCFEDWRKQIAGDQCSKCGFQHYGTSINHYKFCPACGAPMTGEVVEMVIERMEALWCE